ncbi:hypothetical protein M5X00_05050 [Paenibacillus alvei]|uniref:hypothetical protein n=1 Tax=Paenibacillus alvei TaxID=44250 RepID=UPI0021CF076E|nr:hypothetical protein [Paenibacillus alvei]MCY9539119.1 hypothetical protein [Paenibacillus alvei]MCY9707956.1 hypothetical protein [Paenibacillus alvei]MCY9736687.1 hypothetical protein [Paenibacillus alvei]MCY9753627.1 hypothetical protein [Paenibacillus alvei]MEC0078775.1 hypothetical protein [Paenibacillus alvei]
MANKYCNLIGTKKISEDFGNINIGFDKVQQDMEGNKSVADSHIADKTIHVTQADKDNWNSKAPGSTLTDFNAHKNNGDIHVTKAKKDEWDSKAPGNTKTELDTHVADKVVHVTQDDHDKLGSIEEGAEVNQLAFSKVNDVSAKSKTDSLKIKGGIGITVTSNPDTNEVTVTATGDATPGPHAETHLPGGTDVIPFATETVGGLMSEQDKKNIGQTATKLDDHLKSTAAHAAAAIMVDDPEFTDKNVLGVLKYLKSLANSIKTKVAAAIGSPATGGDTGDQLAQKINDAKAVGASNLVAKGISATATESLATLFDKISNIIKGSGNAQPVDVLVGKTFTNDGGVPLTGTMPNRSAENHHMPSTAHTVWPGDRVFLQPPHGYYDGASWVTAPATQLKPENLPKDVNILGVQGTAERAVPGRISITYNSGQRPGVPGEVTFVELATISAGVKLITLTKPDCSSLFFWSHGFIALSLRDALGNEIEIARNSVSISIDTLVLDFWGRTASASGSSDGHAVFSRNIQPEFNQNTTMKLGYTIRSGGNEVSYFDARCTITHM